GGKVQVVGVGVLGTDLHCLYEVALGLSRHSDSFQRGSHYNVCFLRDRIGPHEACTSSLTFDPRLDRHFSLRFPVLNSVGRMEVHTKPESSITLPASRM